MRAVLRKSAASSFIGPPCAVKRYNVASPAGTPFLASWWHSTTTVTALALTLAPRAELSHYAYAFPDPSALGARR